MYSDKNMAWFVCLAIVIILLYVLREPRSMITATDGMSYEVLGKYPNRQAAANLLARVNGDIINFMRHLKTKYHIDETDDVISAEGSLHYINADLHAMVDNALDNYNPEVIYENDPTNMAGETSYTVNKGRAMYVCLRSRTSPLSLVDYNTLMFVLLHEISHIANYNGWGHQTLYWTRFKFILHEAVLYGIYTSVDYERHPIVYCGLTINYNPLLDDTLPNLWETLP